MNLAFVCVVLFCYKFCYLCNRWILIFHFSYNMPASHRNHLQVTCFTSKYCNYLILLLCFCSSFEMRIQETLKRLFSIRGSFRHMSKEYTIESTILVLRGIKFSDYWIRLNLDSWFEPKQTEWGKSSGRNSMLDFMFSVLWERPQTNRRGKKLWAQIHAILDITFCSVQRNDPQELLPFYCDIPGHAFEIYYSNPDA